LFTLTANLSWHISNYRTERLITIYFYSMRTFFQSKTIKISIVIFIVFLNSCEQKTEDNLIGYYRRTTGIPEDKSLVSLIIDNDGNFQISDELITESKGNWGNFTHDPELGLKLSLIPEDSDGENIWTFRAEYDAYSITYKLFISDTFINPDFRISNPHAYPLNSFEYVKVK